MSSSRPDGNDTGVFEYATLRLRSGQALRLRSGQALRLRSGPAWLLAAAIAAYACQLTSVHDTPVDRALPFVAVAVTLVAAVSYSSVMLAVPLLLLVGIGVPDETTRLLAFGVIVGAAFAVALTSKRQMAPVVITVASIAVLRWIPIDEVLPWRELFLMLLAVAVVLILGRTPLSVALAVLVALVTSAVPLRTLALPLVVVTVCLLARLFGMPRVALTWPSTIAVGSLMLFFAWSGVVARALPYFLHERTADLPRDVINRALPAGEAVTLDVPPGAHSLIVSGANVSRFRRGAVLGRVEPGPIVVRVGDAADWGYMRRAEFHGSRNPLPRDPAGRIRGYGHNAWVDGAGRVALPKGASKIRVTADRALPPGAKLQVEAFETAAR